MIKYYLPLADHAEIYDNSDNAQVLIAEKTAAGLAVQDDIRWWRLKGSTL